MEINLIKFFFCNYLDQNIKRRKKSEDSGKKKKKST